MANWFGKGKKAAAAVFLSLGVALAAFCGRGPSDGEGRESTAVPQETEQQSGEASEKPQLKPEEERAMKELYQALESEGLEAGARILIEKEEIFASLFYETLEGKRRLFNGESFAAGTEGEGMVLTSSATVFKGTFGPEGPEGNGLALRAFLLEKPRYDYSVGVWERGKMNGPGETGYCYYEGAPEGEPEEVTREGTFRDDRMEGEVLYTTVSPEEGQTSWEIQTEGGRVILDERWLPDEAGGLYHLPSLRDEGKVYAISPEEAESPSWGNLLIWGEETE